MNINNCLKLGWFFESIGNVLSEKFVGFFKLLWFNIIVFFVSLVNVFRVVLFI